MALWSKIFGHTSDNGASQRREADRRRSERRQSAVVTCDLGQIVEISLHGVRVRCQGRPTLTPGTEVELELAAPTDSMSCRARVIRMDSLRGGRSDLSLDFVGLGDVERAAVENLLAHGKRRAQGAFNNEDTRERLIAALKMPDYYELLGVEVGASAEQVQAAYRALARKLHPDVCREAGADQRFAMINEAHAALMDEARRREYDALYALRRAA